MIVADQSECLAFLRAVAGEAAEVVETHIAVVVLTGQTAFKLKRAVKLPYLDFSTADRRLEICRREVALNRRTAPEMYLGVRRITREPDGLAFDGAGALVDAVVEMRRFDQRDLFDRMAREGRLTPPILDGLAGAIARLHDTASVSADSEGAARMGAVLDINAGAFAAAGLFVPERTAALEAGSRDALSRLAALLDRRAAQGRVRLCHGDLHLRNICLVDGVPTLFDCLEFDEAMATTDVLYDLAFLLMDLWHRALPQDANRVLNRYLDARDEADGLPAMAFLMSVRAAVRAHVAAARHAEAGDEATAAEAESYLRLAEMLLARREPVLVAIGGLSGAGKSTVAAAVAPSLGSVPGARVLSSDRVRKAMHGVAPEARLPAEAYRPEVSAAVYRRLGEEARRVLDLGHAVVVDAVFDRPADRAEIAAVAADAGAPFKGVWLETSVDRLVARVEARRGDPSDATADVVASQLEKVVRPIDWAAVDATASPVAVVEAALGVIGVDHRSGK